MPQNWAESMTDVGVDVGTGSVRVYCSDTQSVQERLIKTVYNDQFITQSSRQIYDSILEMLPSTVGSIAFAATCSMVVKERVKIGGKYYLKPFSCNKEDDATQDIILWMDNRALDQSDYLNTVVDSRTKDTVGGNFIPEMGFPKLKWLSDNVDKELYCFELYDWFSYVFAVGYQDELVEMKFGDCGFESGEAMDGSIKGWNREFLSSIIDSHIKVACPEARHDSPRKLYPVGFPVGRVSQKVAQGNGVIGNGCIDCYAGWVATKTNKADAVSMVAGTSTCFIISGNQEEPIRGIWGPFTQLVEASVFSCGQPATGKLFENLFDDYKQILGDSDGFELVEKETEKLEEQLGQSITRLIKDYYYYGDKFGNRSPYGDFSMSEMLIDGKNKSPLNESILTSKKTVLGLVIKYHLTIEFLILQTAQILERIQTKIPIQSIIISGSQVKNKRLLTMLAGITEKEIQVIDGEAQFNVVKGASLIAKLARLRGSSEAYYQHSFRKITAQNAVNLQTHKASLQAYDLDILRVKKSVMEKMAELQVYAKTAMAQIKPKERAPNDRE